MIEAQGVVYVVKDIKANERKQLVDEINDQI